MSNLFLIILIAICFVFNLFLFDFLFISFLSILLTGILWTFRVMSLKDLIGLAYIFLFSGPFLQLVFDGIILL